MRLIGKIILFLFAMYIAVLLMLGLLVAFTNIMLSTST